MKKLIAIVLVLIGLVLVSAIRGNANNVIDVANGGVPKDAAASLSQAELVEINQLWQGSAHALADVNCSSCHQDSETKELVVKPTQESCQSCHEVAVETFLYGKHGIRISEGLSPLTPAMAHLAMKESAIDNQMNCNSCHNVHSVDTWQASVDSCLTCHNDTHSLNYQNSKHAQLFADQGTLPRPNGESVTCASCHLPRQELENTENTIVVVNHNNTFTLKPRDRMVKEVCMNCHSVEYSYNSIFDDELVEENFSQPPTLKLETFDLVRAFEKKRSSQAEE
ncbi:MAG: hypothetical protein F6K55_38795 [Moorea sp. SIO4A3]|nr:hypothetical protein [Moorena sp. SIO4A3]